MSGYGEDDRVRRRDHHTPTRGAPQLPNINTTTGYESEGYDLAQLSLSRQNSRTPLSPPAEGVTTAPGPPKVHYPPSPQIARVEPIQTYTAVPLNDAPNSNSTPNPSGRSTPNGTGGGGKRRPFSFLPMQNQSQQSLESGYNSSAEKRRRPKNPRAQSWDLLGERPEWEEYKPASAKLEQLRFADGDVGTNKLTKFYYWALNSSIIVRWAFYIIPVLALLWIPGIVGFTAAPEAEIWGVPLLWWSIWASVLWCGFWASTAAFMMVPAVFRATIGNIIPSARKYTDVIRALGRYAKLIPWSAAIWISFTPLIINHYQGAAESNSRVNLSTFVAILFGIFICSMVYGAEKLIVQLIALQFHQDSYADRLADQKFQIRTLTTLYMHSHDIPGRSDTLTDADSRRTKGSNLPKVAIRKALRGLKEVAQTTTTALGNVASEMAGQSVLQTNSPANKVTAALTSANKSKALARRLYYSFRAPGQAHLELEDMARFFADLDTAQAAFAVFDKDGNGNATRDEIEAAVLVLHRERLALEASMRDLDGAVRHLDGIFMVVVTFIWVLVLAAMVTTRITAFVTSAGTFLLGLSWLIGSTMQEILLACIFLFVKHPYDVGDVIILPNLGGQYTVVKMQLLSTNFKRWDGKFVWIGHNVLATQYIENIRRSGPIAESFTFEVAFETTFESLQVLRAKMLAFCKENHRDFLPVFDVVVDDIPAQGKMVLKADIKYKSNWQQGALKVQRRNKWICALKMTLAELKIWGPGGAGDPAPAPADPVQYTLVPYEQVLAAQQPKTDSPPPTFHAATVGQGLMDKRDIVNDTQNDIWGEADELRDFAGPSRPGTPGMSTGLNTPHEAPRGYGQYGRQDPEDAFGGYGSTPPGASAGSGAGAGVQYPQQAQYAPRTPNQNQGQPSTGPVVGPARQRTAHGQGPENIEMTSAPVARRQ